MKYNKGEWSEAFAFVKLIGEGQVFASDEDLNKISDKLYLILKVFKEENKKYYETNNEEGIVNIVNYDGNMIASFESSKFLDIANKSLDIIRSSKGRSFEVPIMKKFLNNIGIDNFKSSNTKKKRY